MYLKYSIYIAFYLLAVLAYGQEASTYHWRNLPIVGGGFVDGIVCHPVEKGLRYARTDMGGAYRWSEDLKKWVPLLDWVSYKDNNLMGIESMAIDPNNPDVLYLACGTYTNEKSPTGEILKSVNRGQTFTRVKVPFKMGGNENGRGNGERMRVDPNNSKVIYLGTRHNGLWRSVDAGISWRVVESFPNVTDSTELSNPRRFWLGGSGIVSVLFHTQSKSKKSTIFVAVSLMGRPNLFMSKNGGRSWLPVPNHPQQYRPTQMALASNGILYVAYGDNPGPAPMTNGAVWKYDIAKNHWSNITPDMPNPQQNRSFGYATVTVDAQNAQHILAATYHRYGHLGGDEIFRSTDGGKTWKAVMASGVDFDYSLAPYLKHTGIHWLFDVEIDPFDSNHVMFTTGYGGHETFNLNDVDNPQRKVIWGVLANGIEETVALELLSPNNGPHLYSAIGDYCGFAHYSLDSPAPDGCFENPHFNNTSGIALAQLNPLVLVRVGQAAHHTGGVNIGYSVDGGKSWQPCARQPDEKSSQGHISVSSQGNAWIWTPQGKKPYLTTDNGVTWHIINELPINTRVVADKVCNKTFYAMSLLDNRFFISSDGGKNFDTYPLNLPDSGPKHGFRGDVRGGQDRLYAVPDKMGCLWLAAYDGLYYTSNSGQSFSRIPKVSQIHGFGMGKGADNNAEPALYLIGDVKLQRGIFRSDDSGLSWVRINNDEQQWGLLLHITGDPKVYGRVYVGTHGRGIIVGDDPSLLNH